MNNNKIVLQPDELGNISSSLSYFRSFNFSKDQKILDIGSNYGSLVYNIHLDGYKNVFGVDVDLNAVEKGKVLYESISHNLSSHLPGELPFNEGEFDVVMMFDVIEHVPDIKIFLEKHVFRVLKKGGIFVFQTPNKYINIPWEIINHKSFTKWKTFHCSLQTSASLEKMLSEVGFANICIHKGDIVTEHNKKKIANKISKIAIPLLYLVQALPLSISSNLWGSARKV